MHDARAQAELNAQIASRLVLTRPSAQVLPCHCRVLENADVCLKSMSFGIYQKKEVYLTEL